MGVLRDSIDKLARLVASSPKFQEYVAAYTADGADSRVHRVYAGGELGQDIESLERPFALISIGARNKSKIAEGVWDGEGFLTLKIAGVMANEDSPGGSLIDFAELCYDILEDIACAAGTDDHLNLREIEQDEEPTWPPPEQCVAGAWCWASWKVRWARF